MKKFLGVAGLVLVGQVMSSTSVFAQSNPPTAQDKLGINTITSAVPFLMVSPDARAGGMGDIGVATEADGASMHWNPAKLGFIEKDMGIEVSYTPWLRSLVPDINLAYLNFYKKINDRTTIGASLKYFSLGDITFTDVNGSPLGQYNPNEFSLDVGATLKLSDKWAGAVAFRFIYSNLTLGQNVQTQSTNAGLAGAGDLGFFYQNADKKLFKRPVIWRFGVSISNIGSKIKYSDAQANGDFIPTNLRLGGSAKLDIDDHNSIMWSMEVAKLLIPTPPRYLKTSTNADSLDSEGNRIIEAGMDPNRNVFSALVTSFGDAPGGFAEEMSEFTFATGVEYWYDKLFAVRAGYFWEHPNKGNRQYFTLGAGVRYKIFGLDFSYLIPTVQRNPLENTIRFTLSFQFDKLKKKKKGDSGTDKNG